MRILTVVLGTLISVSAFAFIPEIPGLSKIEGANIYCAQRGVAYAINTKDKRVWQSDKGDSEGLELTVTRFDRARCPGVFMIEGYLDLAGEKMFYSMRTKMKVGCNPIDSKNKGQIDVVIRDESGREQALKMGCQFK